MKITRQLSLTGLHGCTTYSDGEGSVRGSVAGSVTSDPDVAVGSSVAGKLVSEGSVVRDSVGASSVGTSVTGIVVAVGCPGLVGVPGVEERMGVCRVAEVIVTFDCPVSTPARTPNTSLHRA